MSGLLALAIQVAAQPSLQRGKMSQARLDLMADACRAPRKWLELRGRETVFRADPDADYAKIECVLKKMSGAVDASNLAIVGNAEVSEEK
ncbi:hypothetical protein [uncultured Sphingomonas sp.]|uniref:hypothetical protein n=1 Tax=uncultured Sphingomonas sp. TaxID=158754 RepID=UPI0035C9D3C4